MANIRSSRIEGWTAENPSIQNGKGEITLDAFGGANDRIVIRNKDRNNLMAQFVVGNNAAAGTTMPTPVYVAGLSGVAALPVYPQTGVTLETDSPFKIINPNATPITIIVGQLFLRSALSAALSGNAGAGAAAGGSSSGGGGDRQGIIRIGGGGITQTP